MNYDPVSPPAHTSIRRSGPWRRRSGAAGAWFTVFWAAAVLVLVAALAGCDDTTGPTPVEEGEIAIVLNSVDASLTFFPVASPTEVETIGVGPSSTPVGFSRRNGTLAVPLGAVPAVAVVDVGAREVVRTVDLPQGSGATGSDFIDDSLVVVANPELNSVSVVNILRGTRDEVAAGDYPQAVLVHEGQVFVANAELGEDYSPEGPGTVTVLDAGTLQEVKTMTLSGLNPTDLTSGPDGRLWVLNSGEFSAGNGSLSEIDPSTLVEVEHHSGFGDFPGSLSFGPDRRAYVTSFSYGTAIWNPDSEAFERSPNDAVRWTHPETDDDVFFSGVGFDGQERLYALASICSGPSSVLRLDSEFGVELEIPVGTCPVQLDFGTIDP